MNRETMRRLEALEVKHGNDDSMPLAIFLVVDGMSREGGSERPEVLGWQESMRNDPICVMREPGESEEECGKRAAHTVRAQPGRDPRAVPVLRAVTSDMPATSDAKGEA
ncbi:hypothetical protein [Halomonas sp. HG01]|uniref:hypothetical protein n=1 Tax=Halomonas sp. HG01 TaxID=1609967 RepID=UPI00061490F7|nr:hypothetical protein [Halomonas sp. HG01]